MIIEHVPGGFSMHKEHRVSCARSFIDVLGEEGVLDLSCVTAFTCSHWAYMKAQSSSDMDISRCVWEQALYILESLIWSAKHAVSSYSRRHR